MRSHGLPGFPDPTAVAGGGVHLDVPPAMATSTAYLAATDDCIKLQPAPTPPNGAATQQLINRLRAFAACMRKNGLPHFPDPNGNGVIALTGTGIDKDAPSVVAAGKRCLAEAGINLPAAPARAGRSTP